MRLSTEEYRHRVKLIASALGLSIAGWCREAGVSKRYLYDRFSNKRVPGPRYTRRLLAYVEVPVAVFHGDIIQIAAFLRSKQRSE
jgi:AcrR family transcriptional regulator